MSSAPSSPFKGLNAFADSELDELLFFGREREREIVVANLIASRLTVLYGPSGVSPPPSERGGRTVASRARRNRSSWCSPAGATTRRRLSEAVAEASGRADDGSAFGALEDARDGRDVYLVLDQTEEYFLYHADDGGPDRSPRRCRQCSPRRFGSTSSSPEDSLAKLDRFTGRIQGLFANTLRLDRLDRHAAKAAITGPIDRYAELTGAEVTIEPELIERVLDEVGAGQIEPALGGLEWSTEPRTALASRLPTWLVMQRLWEDEHASGSGHSCASKRSGVSAAPSTSSRSTSKAQ